MIEVGSETYLETETLHRKKSDTLFHFIEIECNYFFVKHDLKEALNCVELEIGTHTQCISYIRGRYVDNRSPQTITDAAVFSHL